MKSFKKRVLTAVLASVMLMTSATTAFAAETTQELSSEAGTQSTNCDVNFSQEQWYKVVLPLSITLIPYKSADGELKTRLDGNNENEKGFYSLVTISASGCLEPGKYLHVRKSTYGCNFVDENSNTLTDVDFFVHDFPNSPGEDVAFSTKSLSESDVASQTGIMGVRKSDGSTIPAGNYTTQISFSISIGNAP